MSILVIGINHRSGPLDVLERLALSADELPKAVETLALGDNIREAVVLSTCNRTEVYAVAERFHGAFADIRDYLCQVGNLRVDELHPYLYSEHDDAAVSHLFSVAAGLDSAVLGESEILGQLKSAWDVAQRNGGARTTMNLLFRRAVEVGKRARTETDIARGTASVSHAAVEMAAERLGALEGRNVVVVGAGAMGEGIAVALQAAASSGDLSTNDLSTNDLSTADHPSGHITVVNRTPERGAQLASRVGGRALGIDALSDVLGDADVVLTCTGSGQPIITHEGVAELASKRDLAERPLLFVDIAVPRDVASDVSSVPGVTVLDLDDLSHWAERGRELRRHEAELVQRLVEEEADRFAVDLTAMQAAPLVASWRQHVETLRAAEVERAVRRHPDLDAEHAALIETITRNVVNKMLHTPSVRLKQQAGTPQGERNAAAVSDLFDLH